MKRFFSFLLAFMMVFSIVLPVIPELSLPASADETDPGDPDNLAYKKPTRSNSTTGSPENVVDGKDNTTWTGQDFPKYVDVDLMANYDISKIKVVMPLGKWAYKIYGSLDGISFDEIASFDYDNATKGGNVHELKNCTYRIVRVNVTNAPGGDWDNSKISEIRVYGKKSTKKVTETREKMEFSSYSEWLKENHGVTLKDNYTVKDTYTSKDTTEAVYGIVERILGAKYKDWFTFELASSQNGKNFYEISMKNGKVLIKGDEGVSIATGLNYYLKYFCKVHVSQQTEQVTMPASIPQVTTKVRVESPYEVRYAYNYCTLSYTMPFYGFDEWQRELDYLALSGVNVILDTTATEALWVMYLQQFGYNADEAKNFVCGYAYKAWWLMGNLENYGGSVSDSWIMDTLELARQNQRFMTVLGIQPCLQGFMGTLPTTFEKKAAKTLVNMGFDNIAGGHMVAQGTWSGFTRPPLLKTNYNGYKKLADTFYDTQKYLYGDITDYYAGDLAHEGGVIPKDQSRSEMASDILGHMKSNDADAVWIIQCWWGNPEKAVLDGFGADNRANHVLVLDLNATCAPNYANSSSWGGKEWNSTGWVFCMLDNFGGRPGVHGELEYMMTEIIKAQKATKHMKGIGLVAEGTQMNPVCQELLWEMAWHSEKFDINAWLDQYVERRYGGTSENVQKAWDILLDTAYGYSGNHEFNINSLVNMVPSFSPSGISGTYPLTYDKYKFEEAVDLFMKDFDKYADKETYIYDAVDLLKQLLCNSMVSYFSSLVEAYNSSDMTTFRLNKNKYMDTIKILDEVCGYEIDSTMGEWIGRIEDWCEDDKTGKYSDYDIFMMEVNAKALITSWSSHPLHSYGYRQYSGQLMDYNYPMWKSFFDAIEAGKKAPDATTYFPYAWDFVLNEKDYDRTISNAKGDANARGLKAIYSEITDKYLYDNAFLPRVLRCNIAGQATAYAKTAQASRPVTNLNNGVPTDLWIATSAAFPTYVGLTFQKEVTIDELIISAETRGTLGADIMQYEIQILKDGEFVKVCDAQSYDPVKKSYSVTIAFEEPVTTTDVRVVLKSVATGSQIWPALSEIKAMSYNTISIKKDANLGTIENGKLKLMPEGTTAAALLAALSAKDGTITITDATGKVLTGNDVVTVGCMITLKNGEGLVDDELTVSADPIDPPYVPPVEPPVDESKITIAPSQFGAWENWVNSPNNPNGEGAEPGVTQLLVAITDAHGNAIDISEELTWKLTIISGGLAKHITMAPATKAIDYKLYRFETCMGQGENMFVPVPGMNYTLQISVYDGDELVYESAQATGFDFPATMEPVVPEGVEPPVDPPVDPSEEPSEEPTPSEEPSEEPSAEPAPDPPHQPPPASPAPATSDEEPSASGEDDESASKGGDDKDGQDDKGGLPTGAIIGIVIGVVAVIGIAVAVVFVVKKKK